MQTAGHRPWPGSRKRWRPPDPVRATWLATDAERIAQSIPSEFGKAFALAWLAETLAATDPDRAEQLATRAEGATQWIASEREKAAVVTGLAQALATITLAVPSPAGAPSGR